MQTEEYGKLFEHEDQYWWFVARRRLALSLVQRHLRHGSAQVTVADVGCGTGAVLAELGPAEHAIGLDASPLALQFCRKRGLAALALGDAEALPLRSESVDVVIALDIVEHVEHDDIALSEFFRSLRPAGLLVMSVPAFRWLWGPHDVALMHFRRYKRSELQSRLRKAGFIVERISYSVFLLFPAVIVIRLMDKFRRGPAKVSLPVLPKWLNRLLIRVQHWESLVALRMTLPWGSSVVAVARKPEPVS